MEPSADAAMAAALPTFGRAAQGTLNATAVGISPGVFLDAAPHEHAHI